jgi:hypothetical protein
MTRLDEVFNTNSCCSVEKKGKPVEKERKKMWRGEAKQ